MHASCSSFEENVAQREVARDGGAWADLSKDDDRFESPEWHAQALREAERAMKNGEAKFSDWKEAKKRIRRKAANLA